MSLLAWHFLPADGKTAAYPGSPRMKVVPGWTYYVTGRLSLCRWGMHASIRPLDALQYAPGPIVQRVEMSGKIIHGDDKLCASERTCLWVADASTVLHEFACDVAQAVLDAHRSCWVTIDPRSSAAIAAKRAWLRGEITDSELDAARDAASAAASTAASWCWYAARAAARDAARDAASAAARDAASWYAASAAARDAAWYAARGAARDSQNADLEQRLLKLAP